MMDEGDSTEDSMESSEVAPGTSELEDSDGAESYRNPEPPPEIEGQLLNADNIGDTVFSKHWLFTILMKLIQAVDGHENGKEQQASGSGHVLDIDDDLQDELCKLWDMSMNTEVVKFLQEFKAIDILTGVIAMSRAPRATEISVGILGNMACAKDVCVQLSQSQKLRDLLLLLFQTPDAPTLVELTRLLNVCVSSHEASRYWVSSIKSDTNVFTHVSFILQSSTNSELLRSTGAFVDSLLYCDDELCQSWGSAEIVLGVLEALKQIGTDPSSEGLETFLHILQLVSTCETGVEALVSYGTDLVDLTMKYLVCICEEDLIGIDDKENSIASAMSVLCVLVASWEDRHKFIQEDFQLVRCVLKILEEVYPRYNQEVANQVRKRRQRSRSDCSHSPPPFSSYISNTPDKRKTDSQAESSQLSSQEEQVKTSLDEKCAKNTSSSSAKSMQDDASVDSCEKLKSSSKIIKTDSPGEKTALNISPKDTNIIQCVKSGSNSEQQTENVADSGSETTETKLFGSYLNKTPDKKESVATPKKSRGKESCTPNSSLSKSGSRNNLVDEYDKKMTQMLYDVIQTCLVEVLGVLKQICFPRGLEEKDKADTTVTPGLTPDRSLTATPPQLPTAPSPITTGIPETLEYLDTSCPSQRIRYFLHVLKNAKSTEERDYLIVIKTIANKFETLKIKRILAEF